MDPLRPTPELSALIQRRIDEIEAESFGAWPVRVCKENLNALPLHGNLIYIWALQPDGTVVWMDHESASHESDVETDPLTIFSVMEQGARNYPELRAIVPPRPDGATECDRCGGTGSMVDNGVTVAYCYGCGG